MLALTIGRTSRGSKHTSAADRRRAEEAARDRRPMGLILTCSLVTRNRDQSWAMDGWLVLDMLLGKYPTEAEHKADRTEVIIFEKRS